MLLEKYRSLSDARRHQINLIGIYIFGVILFAVLVKLVTRLVGSDDTVFQEQIQPYPTLLSWLDYRYHTWSGRIFAESFVYIFSPLPLYLWKIAELVLYSTGVFFLYLYYLLFAKKRNNATDYTMMLLALLIPATIDSGVLLQGAFWVTGSMNYLWISVFGIVALYPIVYFMVRRTKPHWAFTLLGLISAIIAASSQEQVGLLAGALAVTFTLYTAYQRKKVIRTTRFIKSISPYQASFSVIILSSLIFALTSPGNQARVEAETVVWRPDFYTIPLLNHIEYAARWMVDAVVNHSGFLLILIWALIIVLLCLKQKRDRLDYATIGILSGAAFLATAKGYEVVSPLVTFYPTWQPVIPNYSISLAVLGAWIIILIATILAPFVLYRKSIVGALLSLLFIGFLCSVAIITLSPTMYASGLRTLFVPTILLVFLAYILLGQLIDRISISRNNKKKNHPAIWLILWLLTCVAIAQFLRVFLYLHSVS